LSPIEDIAYRRLLDAYYLSERPLNSGITIVARQIGMREFEQEVQLVLEEFFLLSDDGWTNQRADKEIAHFHSKIEQASRAGKASAERRLNARSTDVQPTNNHKPITNNQEPIYIEPTVLVPSPKVERTPSAPISEIVEMFNTKLPQLPRCEVLNDSRKKAISARWRDVVAEQKFTKEQGLEWFSNFFEHIGTSKFLTGKVKPWRADVDFIFKPTSFARIVEGAYHKD
jgi:uncharacterized protein YdaU (DUF1376 family)